MGLTSQVSPGPQDTQREPPLCGIVGTAGITGPSEFQLPQHLQASHYYAGPWHLSVRRGVVGFTTHEDGELEMECPHSLFPCDQGSPEDADAVAAGSQPPLASAGRHGA